jgi:hypothetical protein
MSALLAPTRRPPSGVRRSASRAREPAACFVSPVSPRFRIIPAMTDTAFFRRAGDRFVPTPACRGPWDPKSLHGRVIAGLLGAEIERRSGSPDFQFARLTVDLWKLPGFDPIEVQVRPVREGRRLRVSDAECFAAGASVGRASGVLLRRGENPPGEVWSPPPWDMPHPDSLPSESPPAASGEGWRPMWETRSPDGARWNRPGARRCWIRENYTLVEGEALTPFVRVALAADLTSPLANSGSEGLQFINADITLYLHRLPRSEWLGFAAVDHHATDGVAIAESVIYDTAGAIGRSAVSALAQQRATPPSLPPET